MNKASFSSSWLEVLNTIQQNHGVWNGEDMQIGELTYFSCVGIVIAFIFAPPVYILTHDDNAIDMVGTSHAYQIMEETPLATHRNKRDLFCLETAGLLIECSWQSYFVPLDASPLGVDASGDVIANLLGNNVSNKMNVEQLGLRFYKSFYSERGDIGGYIAMSNERIVISFRGTVGTANVATDMNFMQISLPDMSISKSFLHDPDIERDLPCHDESTSLLNAHAPPHDESALDSASHLRKCCIDTAKYIVSLIPLARQTLPRVHLGFLAAFSSIRRQFLRAFACSVVEHHIRYNVPPKIYVCGHSLGGALALLAGLDISLNTDVICDFISEQHKIPATFHRCIIYTFGSPRVGNATFVNMVHDIVNKNNIFRVEVDGDVICRMPQFLGMYRHCGVHVLIDADESGNVIVHPTIVESQLLRRDRGTTAHHTLSKYRECLEACFLPSQLRKYYYKYYILAHATGNPLPSSSFNTYMQNRQGRDIPDWLTRSPSGRYT